MYVSRTGRAIFASKRFFSGRKSGTDRVRLDLEASIQELAKQQKDSGFDILRHGDFSTKLQNLPVLAFKDKPMFPGFYQVLQTSDSSVGDALRALQKDGKSHVAGFLLKSQTEGSKGAASSSSSPPQAAHVSGALTHPVSFVENMDDVEEIGTLMQIHRIQNNWVALPQWRIKRSDQFVATEEMPRPLSQEELVSEHVLPAEGAEENFAYEESLEQLTSKLSAGTSGIDGAEGKIVPLSADQVEITSDPHTSSSQLPDEVAASAPTTNSSELPDIPPPPPPAPADKYNFESDGTDQELTDGEEGAWREKVTWTPFPPPPPPDADMISSMKQAAVEYYEDESELGGRDERLKALHHEVIASMKELLTAPFSHRTQLDQMLRFYNLDNPSKLVDLVANLCTASPKELQELLEQTDVEKRLEKVLLLIKKDLKSAELQGDVKTQVEEKVANDQRRYILQEKMKQLRRQLGLDHDEKQAFMQEIEGKMASFGDDITPEIRKVVEFELGKIQNLDASSSEFNVCRTYLEWITSLPWGVLTDDNQNIVKAQQVLDSDHYGLEDVKDRILEFMAVSLLNKQSQGKILCLVGPPGVGKTSVGKSIARSLNREYFCFSVGGLHDIAEIRGHRRTYVGAMPGKLIQCLKITGTNNPVVLIDEIDKMGRDTRGDPSSAMLEVLDPEQNKTFRDFYLDVPIDLSKVLFICTANVAENIPGPLLDRMEVLRIAGYTFEEKKEIAERYLIPQTLESSGMESDIVNMSADALSELIRDYAREAGVRNLLKFLERIYRKAALSVVRDGTKEISVGVEDLESYVGQPVFSSDRLYGNTPPPGVVMGLAWTSHGGCTFKFFS